jgi:hypothetical protein
VRNDVVRATQTRQVPWEHSSLWARFYFTPAAGMPPKPPQTASASPNPEQQLELALWNSVKDTANPTALRTYLDRFPQGTFANLARMFVARLERWDAQSAALDRGRQGNQASPTFGTGWRGPQIEADASRCRRAYALLAAKVQEAHLQCGSPRRYLYR